MICSICHKKIKRGDYFVKCSRCGSAAHTPCWVNRPGCGTHGCQGKPSRQFRCSGNEDSNTRDRDSSRYNPKGIKMDRCPVCGKLVLNGENRENCPICHTVYHRDCWEKSGGCILNCAKELATGSADKICPYCMMPVTGEDITVCPKCGIPHHRDCWEENGGCTTYGCDCKTVAASSSSSDNLISQLDSICNCSPKICPYCQSPIRPEEPAVYCESCHTPHHRNCWEENRGCTTYGCRGHSASSAVSPSNQTNQNPGSLPPVQNYPAPPKNQGCNTCLIIIGIFLMLFFMTGGCLGL